MIEILLLVHFCKKIGNIVRPKGRSVGLWRFFLVVAWFGGEILGGIAGAIVSGATEDAVGGINGPVYLCALVGAALGAILAFSLANAVGEKEVPYSSGTSPYAPQMSSSTSWRETGNPYQPPS
jgi:hypothetical protein